MTKPPFNEDGRERTRYEEFTNTLFGMTWGVDGVPATVECPECGTAYSDFSYERREASLRGWMWAHIEHFHGTGVMAFWEKLL